MKPRLYGIAAVLVAVAEAVLCFAGPMAFLRKPSLVLYPLLSAGVSEEGVARLTELLERSIARSNSYSIVSQQFLADYFARSRPGFDRAKIEPVDYNHALRISRELGLERFALAVAYGSETQVELSVNVRESREGESLRSGRFVSDTLEHLLAGVDARGERLDIAGSLSFQTRGMGLTDWLVLALLAFQLGVGVFALFGGRPRMLAEAVWVPALVLFLFAYVHARSANMDYVQRFIANKGQLRMAQSTAREQLYAAARYGPLLLLGAIAYVAERLRTPGAPSRASGRLGAFAARWALPAVVLSACMWSFSFSSVVALDGLGWLAWLSLVPLLLALRGSAPGPALFYGVAFGALQALVVNYWHGTYSYVTLHVLTIVLLAQFLAYMLVLVPLVRLAGRWGFLAVPAAWVAFDWLRSSGLLGYPWGIIGTAPYRFLPLIQIASVTGVWGVDFVVLLSSSCAAWALDAASAAAGPPPGIAGRLARSRDVVLPLACLAAVLAACLVAGGAMLDQADRGSSAPEARRARVLLVQQNTDPRKHDYADHLARLYALTESALRNAPGPVDLVVWPEGGFPVDLRYSQRPDMGRSSWAELAAGFLAFQARTGSWLLTGEQDHTFLTLEGGEEEIRNFNSSMLLDPAGEVRAIYHKRHLVPFTEHFPLDKERFAALYELFQKFDISDWEPGTERLVYEHEKMRLFTPICFEDLFPDEVRRFVLEGADAIVNMSNDYWSLSPVEGRQHGLHALFRAVENRRPLLRATVSGYTVAVDAAGRIAPGSPAPYTEGTLLAEVALPERGLTPYTRYGDWFPRLCLAATAATLLAGLAGRAAQALRGPEASGGRRGPRCQGAAKPARMISRCARAARGGETMGATAIVGANWGDEGKGKMTDYLTEQSDIVVRYQGGNNAGHTVINDYGKFALHLLPSGVFFPKVMNILGTGVAVNIRAFLEEIETLVTRGVPKPQLLVSDRAQVLLPFHQLFDQYEEERLSSRKFGSTRQGIAPFYADKYAKTGIQIADLFDRAHLKGKIEQSLAGKNVLLEHLYHKPRIDLDGLMAELASLAAKVEPYIADTARYLNDALKAGKRILVEGQLGALRDPDHGIYPYSTSSSPLAGFATVGAGIPASALTRVIAVVKAYSSCVGEGPFVSEIHGEEAQILRDRGGSDGEYGATTGRPRRMGWFDSVATRYGCMVQGATDVALSLLDVLGYLEEIPVCTAYEVDGKQTRDFPVTPKLMRAKPVVKRLEGWKSDIRGTTRFQDLPRAAQEYVRFIEKECDVPVTFISTGPHRKEVIVREGRS